MALNKKLIPSSTEEIDEITRKAIQAANRSAEKLRDQKRRLGHKLVIVQDGKVVTVDP